MNLSRGNTLLDSNIDQKENLLSFLKQWFNLDFGNYFPASVNRRLEKVLHDNSLKNANDLIPLLKEHPEGREHFLDCFTVNYTKFFRDPECYKQLVEKVFPGLEKRDRLRVWHAGASTGEEVLSLSILLHEHNLLKRTKILATDISARALKKAIQGTFMQAYRPELELGYKLAGGQYSFEEYFTRTDKRINLASALLRDVEWQVHDLMSKPPQGTFDLILCRNVLIYFNRASQNQVLHTLDNLIEPGGHLMKGSKECLNLYLQNHRFREVAPKTSIYQKRI